MSKPKIYVASSWKNVILVRMEAAYMRNRGCEVDCFADDSTGRFTFCWTEMTRDKETWEQLSARLDAQMFLRYDKTKKAFAEDKKWLDWADTVVLILPAGKSAHLESGYGKGQGKRLFIYSPGGFQKGEFDVMYGFADGLTTRRKVLLNWVKREF